VSFGDDKKNIKFPHPLASNFFGLGLGKWDQVYKKTGLEGFLAIGKRHDGKLDGINFEDNL